MAKLIEITGKALSGEWGNDDEAGNGIPVLRTTNFTNEGIINYNNVVTRDIAHKDLSQKYLKPGDIILEKSGGSDKQPVGRVVFYDGEPNKYLFNNFTGVLRIRNKDTWYPRYVFYALYANYLKGGTRRYENKTTGLHNLKTDQYVQDFAIQEQPLEHQQLVVSKLDKIAKLIALRKEQLAKLDQLLKSRFIELFGDSVTNSMGWATDTVIGVCDDIYGGGTPSKSHPEYYENGDIPWVSSKDMKTDVLYDSQIKINQLGVDNSTAKMVPIKSVIMVIRSGILKHTLPVAINAVPITVNQDLKVFIPSKRILSIFLMHQFKMLEKDILSGVRAVTADNIEFDSLKKREIIVPPMELQEQFAAFVEQADKSKLAIQQSLDKLELLKKSLMQEYFG